MMFDRFIIVFDCLILCFLFDSDAVGLIYVASITKFVGDALVSTDVFELVVARYVVDQCLNYYSPTK